MRFLPFSCSILFLTAGVLSADEVPLSLLPEIAETDVASFKTRDATVSVVGEGESRVLRLDFGESSKYPDVTFAPKEETWNLAKFGGVSVEVTNVGDQALKVAMRVDNPGPVAEKRWNSAGAMVAPGATETIRLDFGSEKARKEFPLVTSEISAVHIFINRPSAPSALLVRSLTASGEPPAESSMAVVTAKTSPPSQPELIRFDDSALVPTMTNLDSRSEVVDGKDGKMLKVSMGADKPYPNVILIPKGGNWNLSPYTRVEVDLINLDEESIQVNARLDNPGGASNLRSNGGKLALDPGESGTLIIDFDREFATELRDKLIGMQRTPWGARSTWGGMIDPTNLENLNLYINRPTRSHTFAVTAVRAAGTFDPASQTVPEPFFPFIDGYGQYRHSDWLNKIKTDADFARIKTEEAVDMDKFPRPTGWNVYGGWADGPQLEKKGHFYTAKQDGKWFLVDPEGRLFFSMGIDVVQVGQGGTPIDERDGWFADAPWEGAEEFKALVHQGKRPEDRGEYKGKNPRLFNFYAANLLRKYGPGWEDEWRALMPRRLMNWGFNTIGNWSDPKINAQGKIPYTHWVFLRTKKLPWQPNTRNPVPDPFDPGFETEVRRAATRMTQGTTDDPFCIGYFVDNELSWHDEDSQGVAALAGTAKNASKLELVKELKASYSEVAALNAAWNTSFASWDALVEAAEPPQTDAGREDLKKFSEHLARKYFATIQKVLKEVAPNKLYLGCRFAEHNPQIVAIAAEYCDVVSFNIYRQKVAAWKPAAPIDKPVIIGEFHFGANDRGVFGSGLVKADNAADRAAKFLTYITGAARNPILVGAHWFALVDEPTTGRAGDQENHGFGFLSITDTPYQEMIEASRQAATKIYSIRSGQKE